MNQPIRRLTAVVFLMFLAIMASVTMVQFVRAPELNADSRNARTINREYARERGPIIAGDTRIVTSEDTGERPYRYRRVYHDGPAYAHITGYFSRTAYAKTGLEKAENSVLSGFDDSLALNQLKKTLTGQTPAGGGVELTIDPKLQHAAIDALAGQKGAIVALEPSTGKILAMVSNPSFDPNALVSPSREELNEIFGSLEQDPNKPLINRAIGDELYVPGSVFKLITTTAMLEAGDTPDTLIEAPTQYVPEGTSHPINNPGKRACGDGSGRVPLRAALAQSCNTPFAIAAINLGQEAMAEQAEKFGFGADLTIPLPVRNSVFPQTANPAELAMSGFGQFDVRVSPLQMAMVGAAIANDGQLMTPYLVDRTVTADLDIISTTKPKVLSEPMSAESAAELTEMMVGVVNNGTGRRAQVPNVEVAGKTGTAEISDTIPPHAWFVGFAPADNPEIVVAVMVENGGKVGFGADGGSLAAPMASAIIQTALAH